MHMLTRISLLGGLLALAILSAGPAAAQKFYKSTLPDGKVIYGDKPVPGAVKVEETTVDTSKRGIGPAPKTEGLSKETAALQKLEQDRAKRDAAAGKVQEAEQALRAAEAARDGGKEPLPGERIGTAGGASRLTDVYFARQKKLEEAVASARRNLELARSGK
jgi:hypothetical protein